MTATIKIFCAICDRSVDTPRCNTDPPDAVELHGIVCPDCDTGGYDMPVFIGADGAHISGDADIFQLAFEGDDQ